MDSQRQRPPETSSIHYSFLLPVTFQARQVGHVQGQRSARDNCSESSLGEVCCGNCPCPCQNEPKDRLGVSISHFVLVFPGLYLNREAVVPTNNVLVLCTFYRCVMHIYFLTAPQTRVDCSSGTAGAQASESQRTTL